MFYERRPHKSSQYLNQIDQAKQIIKDLIEVMETQENRMSGSFHISSEAFKPIWEEAKQAGKNFIEK